MRGSRGSREAGPGAGSPTASDSGSSIGLGSDTGIGIGIGIGIGAAPVRSAFDLSYDRLTPEQARLFRLAALHPAASFHAEQAAALEGAGADETAGRLRALAAASLLTETGRHDDRYRYHDLLRGYARERTEQEDSDSDRREAVRRLLRHYAHTAGQADAALRGALGPDPTRVTARFADRASARRWFDAERPALVGAVQLGAASGFPAETAALAVRLTAYFDLRKRWDEWTATYELASDCARQTGDRAREGLLLGQLGRAYAQQRRYDEALIAYGRSRAAYRAAGDARGAQLVLGRVLRVLQDTRAGRVPLQEAIRRYERAADGLRETDDGDAVTLSGILNNLGNLRFTSGSYDRAAECHARVLRIHEGHGDRRGAAQSLVNLGNALRAAGAAQRAAQHYERAAKTFHEIDDRYGQAQALENLGLAHLASGQVRACRLAWRDAAACFAEAGHTDETERLTAADRSLRLWRRKRAVPVLLRRGGQNYKVPQETWDTPPKTTTGGPAHRDHPPARTRSRAGAYDSSAANDGPAVGTEVPQEDNQDVGAIPGAEPGGDDHGTATTHVFDAEGGEPHEVAHEVSYEGGEDSWHDDLHGGPDDEHIDLDHEFPVADFSHDQDTDQGSDADDENEHDWDDD
ncbi:hypothetical protein [Streptomyces sp. NPDC086519]|uniref:hypothetical protein n=1 Tax=Streptomyces sp. NPDC086519 TaxID=3154863 RepID=UPI003422E485